MNLNTHTNINAKMRNAFATPLVEARLPEDAQNILEEYYEKYIPKELDDRNDNEQYTTYFQQDTIIPLNDILADAIKNISMAYMDKLYNKIPDTSRINIWIQDYRDNQYHSMHMHTSTLVSGIYVLRSNNKGSPLVLTNPDNTSSFQTPYNESNRFCKLHPEKGALYMFPPWVQHYVSPVAAKDVVRTVIAFNIVDGGPLIF